jgi:hypothetical protein
MKMLPAFYRLYLQNNTGELLTFDDGAVISARLSPWKIVSGVRSIETVITDTFFFTAGHTLPNGEYERTDVFDNTTFLNWGINGTLFVTADLDAAVGNVKLFLEFSDEDGNWPSAANDFVVEDLMLIKTMLIDNSGVDKSRSVNFEI